MNSNNNRTDGKNSKEPILLHLELSNEHLSNQEKKILVKYADTSLEGSFIRDILIPGDMPLHNLHYAIQRLFGWQNSHLHAFRLLDEDFDRVTSGRVKEWSELAGVLFQGLDNDLSDRYWDDDYSGGNVKSWMRKKYTGPYVYGGTTEKYDVAQKSIMEFIEHFPALEVKESFNVFWERTKGMTEEEKDKESIRILKTAPVLELTLDELMDSIMLESSPNDLLERLQVAEVLASKEGLLAEYSDIVSGNESGSVHMPVTKKLIYNYDFGDDWVVSITRYEDTRASIEQGTVEEDQLDAALKIVEERYKPVCIHREGGFVVDDVGGMHGFADFLECIYESSDTDRKEHLRGWADYMGWRSGKIPLKNML